MTSYHIPRGGHPDQSQLLSGRAVFTEAYAVIPGGTMRDITASALPHWKGTRLWIVARPMSGFAETFSHYVMEVAPGGGASKPEADPGAEGVVFVTGGTGRLALGGTEHRLGAGAYAYLAPGADWTLAAEETLTFHWVRKRYVAAEGIARPESFLANDADAAVSEMPGTDGRWSTTRFVDPVDMRHDMHVNVVNMDPGASIPFMETHVMEHGLFVLEGKAVYRLNRDWVEVEAGDFMWLRAFCPQAAYAGGPGRFRYLLYKDVNRHARLAPD